MDRFYTPDRLAATLTDALGYQSVDSCADPNCGYGQLLLSAEARWPKAQFRGLDIDRRAVHRVRRRRPQWTVSVGDLLSRRSVARTQVVRCGASCDILLANPPFSMGARNGVLPVGSPYRCSIAMAHIRAAIELFRPRLAVGAIVPESLLYSELDEAARDDLAAEWVIEEVLSVSQATFRGTRAHSSLIVLRPNNDEVGDSGGMPVPEDGGMDADLVRGGLPVHSALVTPEGGVPFVHSTDLTALANGSYRTKSVFPIGRGCVVGAVILLPRVGVPSIDHIAPLEFGQPIQLSDCVIGLRFSSHDAATRTAQMIRAKAESLVSLYKGTGARYVTVRRIEEWCASVGIEPNRTSVSISEVPSARE